MIAVNMLLHGCILLQLLLLLGVPSPTNAAAFSAHLPRPWEQPDPNNGGGSSLSSLMRRRRRRDQEYADGPIAATTTTAVAGGGTRRRWVSLPTTMMATRQQQFGMMTHIRIRSIMKSSPSNNNNNNSNNDNSDNSDNSDSHVTEHDPTLEDTDDDERMVLEDRPRVFIAPTSSNNKGTTGNASFVVSSVMDIHNKAAATDYLLNLPVVPTVRSCGKDLWAMCRPTNYFGILIFHILGTYLGLQAAATTTTAATTTATATSLLSILLQPQMNIVLLALVLTSSTSMMVNDYYDTRSGVDASKRSKPMVSGRVPLRVTKRFVSYLYATLLLCLVAVPGMTSRLSIVLGAMVTFWYTQHLKPITWLKNMTCAALIALAPFTSGAAALELVNQGSRRLITTASTSTPTLALIPIWNVISLWRLFGMLFFGFMGREILMDINDVVDDRLHRVKTVPVKYGRQLASRIALFFTLIMSMLSLMTIGIVLPTATAGGGIGNLAHQRRIVLALAGSVAQSVRALQVVLTNGEDAKVVERAVEEGKTTVLLLLASFV